VKDHPVLPDVDIWQRALSRTDPDPLVVHRFGGYVRNRQLFLLGWVRQTLLARVRDERQFTRLAWVLSSWPDLPTLPRDHEQAAIRMRALRERGVLLTPWQALLWAIAERLDGQVWSRERSWQNLAVHGCPIERA
jgi:hypothetical protein